MNPELQRIIETLKQLKDEVKEKYKAEIIGIFGSYVSKRQKKRSDLDVLVRFDKGATLIHFVGLCYLLEEKIGNKVDVVPYDTVRKEIREQVFKEAIYI